jgi:SAM-dependent methyltransferase
MPVNQIPNVASETFETFRDPAGSLRIEGDRVLRTVRAEYAEDILRFVQSETGRDWVQSGRLIATRVLDQPVHADSTVDFEHPLVFFPSYPWEWVPGQWIAAAELTLDLCEGLLHNGLILKDATPLNILFDGPHAVFVDVLSVERRDPASPIWLAYAQFVRTFLLPLAANKYLGWPLMASIQRRDGFEPSDLYPYLSTFQRWRKPFRSLVTLPHILEQRKKIAEPALLANHEWKQSAESATATLQRNIHALRKTLQSLSPSHSTSRWSGYPQNADHYTEEDQAEKQDFVRNALLTTRPATVLDLGANTGTYSRIAASLGARVVAWDSDVSACDINWRTAQSKRLPIQPLVADVARPTPATGWRNVETLSLLDRARGGFDCVLMLGLIHHLLLSDQIPLDAIASLARELTRKWFVVEWIPSSDPRFRDLLRGRDALYSHLTEEAFLQSFTQYFFCAQRRQLKNGRVLFLFEAI